jgi:hypothetical protein
MTVASLLASLPGSVRIGPFDMALSLSDFPPDGDGVTFGQFSGSNQSIDLSSALRNGRIAADTLLHEITHALWWCAALSDKDKEERTVAVLATGWAQVFRDNPWLHDWLREALQ